MARDVSKIITEIQKTLDEMQTSRKIIRKRVVKWTPQKDFSVEYDEDAFTGSWQYRIYYRINHKEIDCCSLTGSSDQYNMESLIEFICMCEGMSSEK